MREERGQFAYEHVLHEGNGPAMIEHFFAGTSAMPVCVQKWTLAAGVSEGLHEHSEPELEELYVVLAGKAVINLDGVRNELEAGDALLSLPGTVHDLNNPYDEPLEILVVWGKQAEHDYGKFSIVKKAIARRESQGAAGLGSF